MLNWIIYSDKLFISTVITFWTYQLADDSLYLYTKKVATYAKYKTKDMSKRQSHKFRDLLMAKWNSLSNKY